VLGFDGLHTLMAESDYLVVAAALTPQTKHLLSSREFAYAKPGQVSEEYTVAEYAVQ
jgi:phosphoglycerate dehydrogenase-like enzyme